jgi:SAM-dependent methyltransferase
VRGALLSLLDAIVVPFYSVFRLRHPRPARAALDADAAETKRFNAAAEDYFAHHASHDALARKPFSEPAELSRRLVDVGTLIDALRIAPGDTVLEIGAGSCWVSHVLNRFGCRTIAVDVSPTALSIGRSLFARHPDTNHALHPAFVCYDGFTLPLADASVDAIVLYDVFHHLPNPDAVLREMRRVLTRDGIVAMSEPGRGHAASAPSRAESGDTGVLENELVLEEIGERALRAGFTAARFVAAASRAPLEVDIAQFRSFLGGRGLSRYWAEFAASLDSHYYPVLFAGDPEPTTRRPRRLRAVIRTLGAPAPVALRANTAGEITLSIRNVGDTRWLAAEGAGWTRVGAHLSRTQEVGGRDGGADAASLVNYDWVRAALPRDIAPGETVDVAITLPPIAAPGRYTIEFDLVIEGVAWFATRESAALLVPCEVR